MKRKYLILILYLFFSISICRAQVAINVVSWNLKDLGVSKKAADIEMIAKIIAPYDVVAIQEVVADSGGLKALTRLVNELNRG